ncbi:hypothetical protein [Crenobacter cavernae]|uniref:hypothetical protein n=1 Tax=Crenobacter cavernae TaxID=2290923 RepID=UPI00100F0A67|nr:hypothetical protein [Crenobacter cavernae]
MARTFRRRHCQHEYRWVLRRYVRFPLALGWELIAARSPEGQKALARFHSDACFTMQSGAPRWYRKRYKRMRDTAADRQLRRWLRDPGYDPVFHPRHRHDANWSWW